MILKIKSSKENIYKTLFKYLLLEYNLCNSDLEVISELYTKHNELVINIKNFNERMDILFSKKVKNEMLKKIGISYNVFNNSLTRLRKLGLIQNNKLNENLTKINTDLIKLKIEINV